MLRRAIEARLRQRLDGSPGEERWPVSDGVEVIGLDALCREVADHERATT